VTAHKKLRQIRAEFQQALDAEEAGDVGLVYLGDPDNILIGSVTTLREIFGVRSSIEDLRTAIDKIDAELEVAE